MRRHHEARVRAGALVAVVVMALGCANGGESDDDGEAAEVTVDLAEAPDPAAVLPDDRGEAPSRLVAEDLVVGGGAPAEEGSELSVQYVGVRWSDGGRFDSSWERGQPFHFVLGAGRVIPGWDQGIAGSEVGLDPMRVGGRRTLIIPPELAYGERGAGSEIGPGETLVFVVDLVDVDD